MILIWSKIQKWQSIFVILTNQKSLFRILSFLEIIEIDQASSWFFEIMLDPDWLMRVESKSSSAFKPVSLLFCQWRHYIIISWRHYNFDVIMTSSFQTFLLVSFCSLLSHIIYNALILLRDISLRNGRPCKYIIGHSVTGQSHSAKIYGFNYDSFNMIH